ncbi:hypothetical protein HZH66_013129 [Vespula vulgaris]|uniref:Uncharacterized protein n=1 Tax=Vespula vulgaris TaxID=7454 RepID=A0A834MRI9_VESVU|nr:hypothetical protein HZH66_013129 [Vespula vulgaris]
MFLHRTTRTRSEVLEKPHLERTDDDDTVDRRVVARKIGQREEQRKWSLAGGRGGPAEQLVDSASLSVHVDANVSSSLSPLPLLFDTSVSKIAFIASNLQTTSNGSANGRCASGTQGKPGKRSQNAVKARCCQK